MRRALFGAILILVLIEMAFAVEYGNLSPKVGDNISPTDNVSPKSRLPIESAQAIDIVEVAPADGDEYLVLVSRNDEELVLERGSLSINERLILSLPRIKLVPDFKVKLHVGNGNNSNETDIYIGYTSPVLEDAGNVSLIDEMGSVIINKKYP